MKLSTRYGLAGMSGLSLLALVHRLRAEARPAHPAVDYLLGVAPNFAAAIAILFVLLGIWADQKREASFAAAHRAFALCASISGLGLTAWEIVQRSSDRFIFDPHDLAATLAGLILSCMMFHLVTPRIDEGADR